MGDGVKLQDFGGTTGPCDLVAPGWGLGYLISPKISRGKMPMHKSPEFRLGKTQVVENCAVRRLVVLEKHAHDLVVGMRNAPVIPTWQPTSPI